MYVCMTMTIWLIDNHGWQVLVIIFEWLLSNSTHLLKRTVLLKCNFTHVRV